eukprot:2545-Prorocentrum_minimum.AAC.1
MGGGAWNEFCPASNCIDGDYSTYMYEGSQCQQGSSMCHTTNWGTLNLRLRLDLGQSFVVARVVLYNRIDCCKDRLGYHQ